VQWSGLSERHPNRQPGRSAKIGAIAITPQRVATASRGRIEPLVSSNRGAVDPAVSVRERSARSSADRHNPPPMLVSKLRRRSTLHRSALMGRPISRVISREGQNTGSTLPTALRRTFGNGNMAIRPKKKPIKVI